MQLCNDATEGNSTFSMMSFVIWVGSAGQKKPSADLPINNKQSD